MSIMLADIDATCASLGYYDGKNYVPEPDALLGLKHLIWVLRRDNDTHEYRRHLGHGKVLQTDLIPMLMNQTEENEMSDVLLRLLVNLTTPALLLYNETLPKDGPNRRNFLDLVEILQSFKAAFSIPTLWVTIHKRLKKVLEIESVERIEEKGLIVERILVLIRNVLHVPSNPDVERRPDNDASLHDQVLWSLQQAGILDLILYIIGSEYENQYHLHAMEIICLMYREQKAESLADVSLQRSAAEKSRDEQELVLARKRERNKQIVKPPTGRHSRFGGTYVMQNVKSISDRDIICHKPLDRAVAMDFNSDKNKQKRSHRIAKDEETIERRSALSIRLLLRQFAIEILHSAFNNLVRQVRRTLERSSSGNDDSYLLWVIRFFLEFNRLNGFKLPLVSEALSSTNYHWVLGRIQHHLDMLTSDKKNSRLWERRLNIAIQTLKELFQNLVALQALPGEDAQPLFKMLLNNVCYVLEFRETVLHTLTSYNENRNSKVYMRDVVETAHIFFKLMERFCKGSVVVQDKQKSRKKTKRSTKKPSTKSSNRNAQTTDDEQNIEDEWAAVASQISAVLAMEAPSLPEEDHPLPFDALSDKALDDQKDDCMIRIHGFLHNGEFEHAVIMLRSARDVWPQSECFGTSDAAPEDELLLLRDIFITNLNSENGNGENISGDKSGDDTEESESDESDEDTGNNEVEFRFDDFLKRLVNPKVVQACTVVLSDWERLPARTIKSAITLLHRIAFGCKVPIMMFQASLFRVFQQVFDAPRDVRYEEIRRLGVYIMRAFIEVAKTNPKVYAELFFYKSIREANDIEYGYDDQRYANGASKKTGWTEEQEAELNQLFMENQNNPSTEKDVIDWILDNLIDKNRTRRAVIKKLKELGLIFKAPTRKSVASAVNKHLWKYEEDTLLKELYDEHRLDDNCLVKIMESFVESRSRNSVIKRMIELGLIAERSEILPNKRRKSTKSQPSNVSDNETSDSDSNDSDGSDERDTRKVRLTVKTAQNSKKSKKANQKQTSTRKRLNDIQINVADVQRQIVDIDENLKQNFVWLQESLNDAADDAAAADDDDNNDDPNDGVPIVPYSAAQKEALENPQFRTILLGLGLHEPIAEMETYWRIPVNMTVNQMRLAARIVGGESVVDTAVSGDENEMEEDDNNFERLYVSDSEDDSFSAIEMDRQNRLQKTRDLIYNDSDDENEREVIMTTKQRTPIAQNNVFDMIRNKNDDNVDKMDENEQREQVDQMELGNISTTTSNKNVQGDNAGQVMSSVQFDSEDFNSQVIRRRLAELDDSDEDGDGDSNDNDFANEIDEITNDYGTETRLNNTKKRERSILDEETASTKDNTVANADDDDEDDEDDGPIMRPKNKKARLSVIDDNSDDD